MIAFNFLTGASLSRSQVGTVHKVIERLWDDPELDNTLKALYAGPSFGPPRAWQSSSSNEPPIKPRGPLEPAIDMDITHIEAVCSFNSFSTSPIIRLRPLPDNADAEDKRVTDAMGDLHGNALYALSSLINHACQPNAYWFIWGDLMVIRAFRSMKKGEEITISYVPSTLSFSDRRKLLTKWGFECQCVMCNAESTEGLKTCLDRASREKRRLAVAPSEVEEAIKRTKQKIKTIEDAYKKFLPNRSSFILKPILLREYSFLSTLYLQKADSGTRDNQSRYIILSIKESMKVLELGGVIIKDSSISDSSRSKASSARTKDYLPIDTKLAFLGVRFNLADWVASHPSFLESLVVSPVVHSAHSTACIVF